MADNRVLSFICQVLSRERHVSKNGRDSGNCGLYLQPCQTIRYAIRYSNPGDTILIDFAQGRPYQECEENEPILIGKSLTIRGINGQTEIQCWENKVLFFIKRTIYFQIRLTLEKIILSNSEVAVKSSGTDIYLVVNDCTFRNNSMGIRIGWSKNCSVTLNNTCFHRHFSTGIMLVPCDTSVFTITNSRFFSTGIRQETHKDKFNQKHDLSINNCSFLGEKEPGQSFGNAIYLHSCAKSTRITINNTIFYNLVALNSKEYLLWIKDKYVSTAKEATSIKLDRLTFKDNYWKKRLMYLEAAQANSYSVSLENSLFENNTGTINFAVSLAADDFNNYSSMNRVLLKNNMFLGNRYFPTQGLAGIYATVFFIFGSFEVVSCKFIDNHQRQRATTLVISVSDMAYVILKDCYFEVGKVASKSIQVLAYPNSILKILGNNTFNISKLNEVQNIFLHLPSNKLANLRSSKYGGQVLLAGILNFVCPQGFNATISWTIDSQKSQNETLAFTYFNVICWPCPRKTYSLQRGVLTTIPKNTTYNSSRLILRRTAKEFTCHECPRGGRCVLGYLKAKENFWGYRVDEKVRFIDCPRGYCCDRRVCPTYNTCKGQRTGRLCGQCPRGTSESLFSTACRQNNTCNASIFFPAAVFLILAFIIFFLYYEDIAQFLQKGLTPNLPSLADLPTDTVQCGGCIKIIFYYYQTMNLLMSNVALEKKKEITQHINNLISQVFNFLVADTSSFDCPLPSITPVTKALLSHSCGLVLLITLGIICLVWKLCGRIMKRKSTRGNGISASMNLLVENDRDTERCEFDVETYDADDPHKASFTERALGAFTHICLLMYSTTARLCLTLLHCIPYKQNKLLFIDGNIHCYQPFQYVLLAYTISSVLPFCMVPFLGSYVLNLGLISVTQFCFGCLLPFPFCCYWLKLLLRRPVGDPSPDADEATSLGVRRVLSGPFRIHEAVACFPRSPLAWEGVLILRRLMLILFFTFIHDRRWRTLSALTGCTLILVVHLAVKPFRKRWENWLEAASLTTLVIFCGFTLVKALYRGEDYSSLYTNSSFIHSLHMIERPHYSTVSSHRSYRAYITVNETHSFPGSVCSCMSSGNCFPFFLRFNTGVLIHAHLPQNRFGKRASCFRNQ